MNISKKETMRFIDKHGSYGALLFDKRWLEYRKKILERDNYECRVCKAKDDLQIHHRQYHYSLKLRKYRKPWEYPENLLISLCGTCHQKGHQLYKIPTKYV